MRTTFTIDQDLLPKLKALVRRKKEPMRKVLNNIIRAAVGINHKETPSSFVVEGVDMGLKPGYDLTKLNSLYDQEEVLAYLASNSRKRRKPLK